MKTRLPLLFVAILLTAAVPLLLGAGTPSKSTPPRASVSKDVKYYNQGVKAQNQGDYQRAVELYRKALRVNPNFADALNNLGFSLRSIGKQYMDEAMQSYDRALQLKRDHQQALEYQGELYLWRGQLQKANENYQRLRRLNSREATKLKKHLDRMVAQAKQIG
ncbi:MAG: tetratricopeptide repeat protein [Acidiferrobacterales bacterium]